MKHLANLKENIMKNLANPASKIIMESAYLRNSKIKSLVNFRDRKCGV